MWILFSSCLKTSSASVQTRVERRGPGLDAIETLSGSVRLHARAVRVHASRGCFRFFITDQQSRTLKDGEEVGRTALFASPRGAHYKIQTRATRKRRQRVASSTGHQSRISCFLTGPG